MSHPPHWQHGGATPWPLGKILCVGLNYRKHAEESGAAIPTSPVLFSKFNNSIAAANEDVPLRASAKEYDYEVELAVKGSEATLAISDERDQPVDASAFSATAVALARGNERRTMEFRPAGENRLAARVDFPFDGKFRATVTLRGPGGDLGQARFNVDATR